MVSISPQRLQNWSNIAILLVACLAAYVYSTILIRDYDSAHASASPAIGQHLALPGIDWEARQRTVILALSSRCHFCTESSPFYKELVGEAHRSGKFQVVAAFAEPLETAKQYLNTIDLAADGVVSVAASELQIGGTPTLIVTDKSGVVYKVWIGKLKPQDERAVKKALAY